MVYSPLSSEWNYLIILEIFMIIIMYIYSTTRGGSRNLGRGGSTLGRVRGASPGIFFI
jgi:hypothetical protein